MIGAVLMILILKKASKSSEGLVKIPISGAHPRVSDSASLAWRPMIWSSNKFPGNANSRSYILRTTGVQK